MPKHDDKRPTLQTIADITGLSLSTVSLSLRNGSNLRQNTKNRVAQAAKQIGYVPNRAGVRLRTGRTNVLALVLVTDQNMLDLTRQLLQGIGAHIHDTPYHLNVIPEFERSDSVACVEYILENRSADGVILTHTSARDPRVQLLQDANFPFVSHGRTEFYTPHAYHDFHAECFIQLAIERLINKGRRRILLAVADTKTTNFGNIVGEFKRTMASTSVLGNVVEDPEILNNTKETRALGQSLAQQSEQYDGIICFNELIALSLISGLQDKEKLLGQHYDLICKQSTEILPTLYPTIDTMSEDMQAVGRELARLLIQRIDNVDVKELQTISEPITHWRSH